MATEALSLLAVVAVSFSLSVLTNIVSRRFGIGAWFRREVERASLDFPSRLP